MRPVAGDVTPDEAQKRMLRRTMRVFAVGWLMVIAVIGFWLVGNYVDRRLDTRPIATIVLTVLAVAGGVWQSYRTIMGVLKD